MAAQFFGSFCKEEVQQFDGSSTTNESRCCYVLAQGKNKGHLCNKEGAHNISQANPQVPVCDAHSSRLFSGSAAAYKMTYFADSNDEPGMIFERIHQAPFVVRSARQPQPRPCCSFC